MIEVKHLTKRYGKHLALDDLSFTIEKGQIYGFLGPNGAGKSTTMNIMTGYIGATEGEVLINGYDILEEPEKAKKSIGYLPEIPPLYLDMTVEEYLLFAARLKKLSKKTIKAEVANACHMVKIEDVKHRLIRNLSKGYRQRVGLACAVLGSPEIIILDEPTVGLDPKQIIEIRQLIRNLAKDHTVILSSHILAEVQEICDYILIISKGKLVASDTPDHLEELFSGKESVSLTVQAEKQAITQVLASISGIKSIQWGETSKDACQLIIEPAKDAKVLCQDLSLAFAQNQLPVTQMYTDKVTLEDIFLTLTEEQPEEQLEEQPEETTPEDEPQGGNTDDSDL